MGDMFLLRYGGLAVLLTVMTGEQLEKCRG